VIAAPNSVEHYRDEKTRPLDIVGLILFRSGIALLSYVLEIFGEHSLSAREMSGLLVVSLAFGSHSAMSVKKMAVVPQK
jgi:hypothetical protein